jgi:dihydroxyacetone kinase-like predicted kinase
MASTVRAIVASLATFRQKKAGSVLSRAAQSALAAAKGNSGAILAQFFSALAEDLDQEARISAKRLADAAVRAAEKTRKALSIPREGTILTVLHDWAHAMHEKAQQSDDILNVFTSAYESAKASLARTRDMLPEMQRAGVVDAGAKGFVHMLDGIAQFIQSGSLREMLRTEWQGAKRTTGRPERPRDHTGRWLRLTR